MLEDKQTEFEMQSSHMKRRVSSVRLVLAATASAMLIGSPASALTMDNLFDWMFASGGDGGHGGGSKADGTDEALQTPFLPDPIPPMDEDPMPDVAYEDPAPSLDDDGYVPDMDAPRTRGARPVPEPTAALLFGAGAFVVAQRLRRRR